MIQKYIPPLLILLLATLRPAVASESRSYKELELLERSQLIERGEAQIAHVYHEIHTLECNSGDFPHVVVQKNGVEISVTFFHSTLVATGNEGEIFEVTANLISGDMLTRTIYHPFGSAPEWPFDKSATTEPKFGVFYSPSKEELATIDSITQHLNLDFTGAAPDERLFIYENVESYGVVITDGYWTGFTLCDKAFTVKQDMGYSDELVSPPEHPWVIVE